MDTEEDYIRSLEPPPDPILSDHRLPQFDSVRALARLQDRQVDVPFHIVSGKIGEDLAVGLLKEGAEDFVLKERLAHLGPAVPRALERKNPRQEKRSAEQRLVASERRFRALIERGSDEILLFSFSPKAEILYSSPSTVHILGYSREDLAGRIAFMKKGGRQMKKRGTYRFLKITATMKAPQPIKCFVFQREIIKK